MANWPTRGGWATFVTYPRISLDADVARPPLPPEIAQMLPMEGHVFENKYRILELSGAGGFARVYRARFEDVGRDVALKVLVPQSGDPAQMYPEELVTRFHREARAVSHLKSPYTITLHDFGRTSRGLLYMIFEFVEGLSLNRYLKKHGPIPAPRVVPILMQCLHSLREAHAMGILHRDVKPANIMLFDYLDETDIVKVLDFGIAKRTHAADGKPISEDLTEAGAVMGTPRYMSPEQIVGQELTPATDIYSLGLVIYEMLVGVPAASETEKSAIVRRHLGPEPIYLPRDVRVPTVLAQIVERMLAKEIGQRFQSADEVMRALEQLSASASQPMRAISIPSEPAHGDWNDTRQQPTKPGTSRGWAAGAAPTGTPQQVAPAPSYEGGEATQQASIAHLMSGGNRTEGFHAPGAPQRPNRTEAFYGVGAEAPSSSPDRTERAAAGYVQHGTGQHPAAGSPAPGTQRGFAHHVPGNPTVEAQPGLGQPEPLPPTGLGGGAPPAGFGTGPGAQMSAAASQGTAPASSSGEHSVVPQPKKSLVRVRQSAKAFEVDVPIHPNKRALLVLGVTFVFFSIAWIVSTMLALLAIIPLAWAVSLAFRTYALVIDTETGYELTMSVFTFEKTKRGPMASVVRFQPIGTDEDEDTVLKIITHEGEFVVANAFSEEENEWVAATGNEWLARVRAKSPAPLG